MKDIMPSAVRISIFALLFTSMVFQSAFAQEHDEDEHGYVDEHEKKHEHGEKHDRISHAFAPSPSESLPNIVEKKFHKAFASSPSKGLPEIIEDFKKKFAASPSPSESKHYGENKKHLGILPFPKFGFSGAPISSEHKKDHKEFASSPSKGLPEIIEDFKNKFAASPSPSESKHYGENKKHLGLLPFSKFGFSGAPTSSEHKKDHYKFFKSLPPLPSFSSLSPSASIELKVKKQFFAAASPASSPASTYKPHFDVVPEEAAEPKNMGRKLL